MAKRFLEHYSEIVEALVREIVGEDGYVSVVDPQRQPNECIARGLRYEGLAEFRLGRSRQRQLNLLMPTEYGTFVANARVYSPTLTAVRTRIGRQTDLATFVLVSAEILRLVRQVRKLGRSGPEGEDQSAAMARRITPALLEGMLNLSDFKHLQVLDLTNLLAEVADSRKVLFRGGANAPRDWRFVDPSHHGVLCPLETPESKAIGLRLHVVEGAALERYGPSYRLAAAPNDAFFGLSSLLVPFIHHDDGARAMMGGKNLKAAVPLLKPELPLVRSGAESRIVEASGRLVRARIDGEVVAADDRSIAVKPRRDGDDAWDDHYGDERHALVPERPSIAGTMTGNRRCVAVGDLVEEGDVLADWPGTVDGALALGINVLVAYLPFHGYNIEDGIVISERLAKRFTSRHLYDYSVEYRPDLDEEAISYVAEGAEVRAGDVLAVVERPDGTENVVSYRELFPGTVRKTAVDEGAGRVALWIEALRTMEVGDKMTGRHGNKGVVSRVLSRKETPFFVVGDKRHYVEAIVSPMGVVSRMNLGQLLETHYGWIARQRRLTDQSVGEPFHPLDTQDLVRQLRETGLPDGRAELFVEREGEWISLGESVVGYQYLSRLNHLARDKIHVRGAGPEEVYSRVTRQPVGGARRGGGQRLGEMETWALLAHGARDILGEAYSVKSDADVALLPETLRPDLTGTMGAARTLFRALGVDLSVELDDQGGGQPEYHLRRATPEMVRSWALIRVAGEEPFLSVATSGQSKYIVGPMTTSAPEAANKEQLAPEPPPLMPIVELPVPVPHPLFTEDSLRRNDGDEGLSQWKRRFDEERQRQGDLALEAIPILPISYRPSVDSVDADAKERHHPLTRLYQRLVNAAAAVRKDIGPKSGSSTETQAAARAHEPFNNPIRKVLAESLKDTPNAGQAHSRTGSKRGKNKKEKAERTPNENLYRLYSIVNQLFLRGSKRMKAPSIASLLEGKYGLLRRHLLGRRQDYSGRAVIVPDPSLTINECGLPLDIAMKLFEDRLLNRLRDKHTRLREASRGEAAARRAVRVLLEKIIYEENLLVLLNRQPSLHRYSILAFTPRIRDDYVLALPPLVCAGFNADFDGDTMAVHLPRSPIAQKDAARLLPSRHLFSVANGDLLLNLGQDYALGAYLLSRSAEGRERLADLVAQEVRAVMDGKELVARLSRAVEGLSDPEVCAYLKRLQDGLFEAATCGEASFGFVDVFVASLSKKECEELTRPIEEDRELASLLEQRSETRQAYTDARAQRLLLQRALKTKRRRKRRTTALAPSLGAWLRARSGDSESGSDSESIVSLVSLTKDELSQRLENAWSQERTFAATLRELDAALKEMANAHRSHIEESMWVRHNPDNAFSRYFLSRARGNETQFRQIAGAIGPVFGSDGEVLEKALKSNFVHGLSPEEYWLLSFSTRRTMLDKKLGVANAGALTRDLVEGAYDLAIVAKDCGTCRGIDLRALTKEGRGWAKRLRTGVKEKAGVIRSPLTCDSTEGICQRCYGRDPATGHWPEIGSLVGVIAGQSVGERGTQLSMRTFHTGEAALPIEDVHALFGLGTVGLNEDEGEQSMYDAVIPKMLATYKKDVAAVHFEVLMRAMLGADGIHGLQSVAGDAQRRGVLSALTYRSMRRVLRECLASGEAVDLGTFVKSRLITGGRL